jgi:hypothetical protein
MWEGDFKDIPLTSYKVSFIVIEKLIPIITKGSGKS